MEGKTTHVEVGTVAMRRHCESRQDIKSPNAFVILRHALSLSLRIFDLGIFLKAREKDVRWKRWEQRRYDNYLEK